MSSESDRKKKEEEEKRKSMLEKLKDKFKVKKFKGLKMKAFKGKPQHMIKKPSFKKFGK